MDYLKNIQNQLLTSDTFATIEGIKIYFPLNKLDELKYIKTKISEILKLDTNLEEQRRNDLNHV
jgi:hypothetical protein